MGSTSVTGKGVGDANKPTTKELAIINQGPAILQAGVLDAIMNSFMVPPTAFATLLFDSPLPGGRDAYSVLVSSQAGTCNVINKFQNSNNEFTGILVSCSEAGDINYAVISSGKRPKI